MRQFCVNAWRDRELISDSTRFYNDATRKDDFRQVPQALYLHCRDAAIAVAAQGATKANVYCYQPDTMEHGCLWFSYDRGQLDRMREDHGD